ncbi:MAG: bifunctional riboflavin kinase/FAD synthetase [Dehalococcoidales bacterium]
MQVEEELAGFSPQKDMLLTIGVFDGVHLGHKYLISRLKEQAAEKDLLSGIVTFRQHPLELLAPQTRLPYLTSLDEKVYLLKEAGADVVIPLTFSDELARLGAGRFAGLLKKHLRMAGLIIGPDFALGKNREGNAETLVKLGREMGFFVTVINPVLINGEVISSTAIRKALAEGDVKKMIALIGRSFSLKGRIVAGDGRGRKLGFPTANMEIDEGQTLPADGIYATRSYIDDRVYQSVTNIGTRPTFGDNQRTVETYILDYSDNLYGQELKIDIVERLRGEKRFDSVEKLEEQMAEDVKQGRAVLDALSGK